MVEKAEGSVGPTTDMSLTQLTETPAGGSMTLPHNGTELLSAWDYVNDTPLDAWDADLHVGDEPFFEFNNTSTRAVPASLVGSDTTRIKVRGSILRYRPPLEVCLQACVACVLCAFAKRHPASVGTMLYANAPQQPDADAPRANAVVVTRTNLAATSKAKETVLTLSTVTTTDAVSEGGDGDDGATGDGKVVIEIRSDDLTPEVHFIKPLERRVVGLLPLDARDLVETAMDFLQDEWPSGGVSIRVLRTATAPLTSLGDEDDLCASAAQEFVGHASSSGGSGSGSGSGGGRGCGCGTQWHRFAVAVCTSYAVRTTVDDARHDTSVASENPALPSLLLRAVSRALITSSASGSASLCPLFRWIFGATARRQGLSSSAVRAGMAIMEHRMIGLMDGAADADREAPSSVSQDRTPLPVIANGVVVSPLESSQPYLPTEFSAAEDYDTCAVHFGKSCGFRSDSVPSMLHCKLVVGPTFYALIASPDPFRADGSYTIQSMLTVQSIAGHPEKKRLRFWGKLILNQSVEVEAARWITADVLDRKVVDFTDAQLHVSARLGTRELATHTLGASRRAGYISRSGKAFLPQDGGESERLGAVVGATWRRVSARSGSATGSVWRQVHDDASKRVAVSNPELAAIVLAAPVQKKSAPGDVVRRVSPEGTARMMAMGVPPRDVVVCIPDGSGTGCDAYFHAASPAQRVTKETGNAKVKEVVPPILQRAYNAATNTSSWLLMQNAARHAVADRDATAGVAVGPAGHLRASLEDAFRRGFDGAHAPLSLTDIGLPPGCDDWASCDAPQGDAQVVTIEVGNVAHTYRRASVLIDNLTVPASDHRALLDAGVTTSTIIKIADAHGRDAFYRAEAAETQDVHPVRQCPPTQKGVVFPFDGTPLMAFDRDGAARARLAYFLPGAIFVLGLRPGGGGGGGAQGADDGPVRSWAVVQLADTLKRATLRTDLNVLIAPATRVSLDPHLIYEETLSNCDLTLNLSENTLSVLFYDERGERRCSDRDECAFRVDSLYLLIQGATRYLTRSRRYTNAAGVPQIRCLPTGPMHEVLRASPDFQIALMHDDLIAPVGVDYIAARRRGA